MSIVPELALPPRLAGVVALPLDPEAYRTVHLALPADPAPPVLAFADLAVAEVPAEYRPAY
ncbi:hypothetical protein [Spongiactinospora sp. TRM90649]|uniref:hypothetical protein n=1 Tax=Spongiactinospora sp. TRM90649 TaxID=3031114 RepID=UPI0023F9D579|nr:hypothetical protein [Spongiactinospora sp. TRM90649]MDF5754191.1 hypothetical protein [Spongiactinospora sp. TRM90649]